MNLSNTSPDSPRYDQHTASTLHPYLDSSIVESSDSEIETSEISQNGNSALLKNDAIFKVNEQTHFKEWDSLPEKHLVSDANTYLSYFKAFVGTGVLFLPGAFVKGGLATTLFLFILTTWLSTVCMLKLVDCKHRIVEDFKNDISHGIKNTHQVIGFGLLGHISFGDSGRWIVDLSIAIGQMAGASAYLIFTSSTIVSIINQMHGCVEVISATALIWIIVCILIPFMFIRQLAKFRYQIIIADVLINAGLLYIFTRSSILVSHDGLGPNIIQFDKVGFWSALGTALFALEGTAFVLPIEHAMRNKENFNNVTLWSGIGIGTLYMVFGLVGYLAFGSGTIGPITGNFKTLFPTDDSVTALQIGYCLALLLSFPVVMFPAVKIFEAHIFPDHLNEKSTVLTWKKNFIRALLVIICGLIATGGGTSFDNFISLVGGLICVPLTFLYPAYFHHKICGDRLTKSETFFNYFIIVVGVFGSVACTVVSILQWETSASAGKCSIH